MKSIQRPQCLVKRIVEKITKQKEQIIKISEVSGCESPFWAVRTVREIDYNNLEILTIGIFMEKEEAIKTASYEKDADSKWEEYQQILVEPYKFDKIYSSCEEWRKTR